MVHHLVRGGDAAAGRVIVSAEMRGDAPAAGRVQKPRQVRFPALVENRLRRFDHHLESQRAFFKAQRRFHRLEQVRQRGHLFGDHHLGQSDNEICGQASAAWLRTARSRK